MRIVSLLPSATEMCYALDLGPELAAVTHECDYPPDARHKPHATRNALSSGPHAHSSAEIDRLVADRVAAGLPIYELDVPLLQGIAPDLLLTQQLCDVCAVSYQDVLAVARELPGDPRVVSLEPTSLEQVLGCIEQLGSLTMRAQAARAVVNALRQRLDWIAGCLEDARGERPAVVCLEWLDPPMVGGHWVPEMVERAGGRDVLGQAGKPSHHVSWEQVVDAQPDVLILMPCGYDLDRSVEEAALLQEVEALADVAAVRRGQVYAVDGSAYFNRPGPRLVQGVAILANVLHPAVFGGITPGVARCLTLPHAL